MHFLSGNMAAHGENVRVKLYFKLEENVDYSKCISSNILTSLKTPSLYLVQQSEIQTVGSLQQQIKQKFALQNCTLSLFVAECIVPKWESTLIFRDNDSITARVGSASTDIQTEDDYADDTTVLFEEINQHCDSAVTEDEKISIKKKRKHVVDSDNQKDVLENERPKKKKKKKSLDLHETIISEHEEDEKISKHNTLPKKKTKKEKKHSIHGDSFDKSVSAISAVKNSNVSTDIVESKVSGSKPTQDVQNDNVQEEESADQSSPLKPKKTRRRRRKRKGDDKSASTENEKVVPDVKPSFQRKKYPPITKTTHQGSYKQFGSSDEEENDGCQTKQNGLESASNINICNEETKIDAYIMTHTTNPTDEPDARLEAAKQESLKLLAKLEANLNNAQNSYMEIITSEDNHLIEDHDITNDYSDVTQNDDYNFLNNQWVSTGNEFEMQDDSITGEDIENTTKSHKPGPSSKKNKRGKTHTPHGARAFTATLAGLEKYMTANNTESTDDKTSKDNVSNGYSEQSNCEPNNADQANFDTTTHSVSDKIQMTNGHTPRDNWTSRPTASHSNQDERINSACNARFDALPGSTDTGSDLFTILGGSAQSLVKAYGNKPTTLLSQAAVYSRGRSKLTAQPTAHLRPATHSKGQLEVSTSPVFERKRFDQNNITIPGNAQDTSLSTIRTDINTKLCDIAKDYSHLPIITASPRLGDRIAFKMLELDERFNPGVSDFKITDKNTSDWQRIYKPEDNLGATSTPPLKTSALHSADPSKTLCDGSIAFLSQNAPLSNFHSAVFVIGDITYNCVEQYYQARKAEFAKDKNAVLQIMKMTKPNQMKIYAKKRFKRMKFLKTEWEKQNENVIAEAIEAKFTQNAHLCQYLLHTGTVPLLEASPDKQWGIGLHLENPALLSHSGEWPGQNKLGNLLMKLRDKLHSNGKSTKSNMELVQESTIHQVDACDQNTDSTTHCTMDTQMVVICSHSF